MSVRRYTLRVRPRNTLVRSIGLAAALASAAMLAWFAAAPAAHAQSRTQFAGGLGIATGAGSLGDLTGVGMSGSFGVGFPRGDRFTIWLEGWAEGLPSDGDPLVEQADWQYSTTYLAAAEYRFTAPWNPWRLSGTLGLGATTFWDNSWARYSIDDDGSFDFNTVSIVQVSGTHFTVAPGFRVSYAYSPNLDLELAARVSMSLHEGEAFAFDTAGVRTELAPPGSPITSWGLTLGTRLRAGGPPSEWSDLEPGDRVRVWATDGRQAEGRLVSVDTGADGGLRLRETGTDGFADFDLAEIQNAAVRHTRAQSGGILGAAIGGGAGALLGLLAAGVGCALDDSASGCTGGEWAAATIGLGLTGGVAGFVMGSLLGGSSGQWRDLPPR